MSELNLDVIEATLGRASGFVDPSLTTFPACAVSDIVRDLVGTVTALRVRIEELEREGDRLAGLLVGTCGKIEELEARQRWVPVEEELPAIDEDVLICYYLSRRIDIGSWHKWCEQWQTSHGWLYKSEITHWLRPWQPGVAHE